MQSLLTLLRALGTLTLSQVTLTPDDPYEYGQLLRCRPKRSPCWAWTANGLLRMNRPFQVAQLAATRWISLH